MKDIQISGRALSIMEAVASALETPSAGRIKTLPRWLPDGSEVSDLSHVALLTKTDRVGAAFYVLEAQDSPSGLVAQAKAEIASDRAQRRLSGIQPPPADDKDGIAVMVPIPLDMSQRIAIQNGMPAEQMHITIAYYGNVADFNRWPDEPEQAPYLAALVRQAAIMSEPFTVQLNGLTRFSTPRDSMDPLVVNADSPELENLRNQVVRFCGPPASEHGYTPHMTIGYLPTDEPLPFNRWEPISVRCTTIVLGWGGKYIPFALGDGGHQDEMKDISTGSVGPVQVTGPYTSPFRVVFKPEIIARAHRIKKKRKKARKLPISIVQNRTAWR